MEVSIMEPRNTNWDESGFEAEGGFMSDAPREEVRKRVEVLPPLPQPPQERKRSPLYWISVVAGLLLFVSLIGYSVILFLSGPSAEEEAFIARDSAPAPTTVERVVVLDSIVVPPVEIAEAVKEPMPVMSTMTPKPISSTPPDKSIASELWVVQVFSSPSRDDADEWLQTLRNNQVKDGYIVEQKIRGQSWYRVRFGEYTSMDEAESAARTMGYKQPWIARVR